MSPFRAALPPLLLIALSACCPAPESPAEPSIDGPVTAIPATATESRAPRPDASATATAPGVEAYRRGDYAAALAPLRAEAEAGDAEAQFLLGELHFRGRATPRNYAQARHWLQRAAERKHPEAQHRLAEIFAYGYGVPRDTVAANRWEGRARANGWGAQTGDESHRPHADRPPSTNAAPSLGTPKVPTGAETDGG